jgi:L-threonylcarbamoyladenylate synthase
MLVAAGDVGDTVRGLRAHGVMVGALERAPGSGLAMPAEVLADEPAGYAAGLYAALHRLEDAACEAIVLAEVPAGAGWAAVRDRLRRASA